MKLFLQKIRKGRGLWVGLFNGKLMRSEHVARMASLCVLVLTTGIGGCKLVEKASWSEEVKLHDGRLIVIDRIERTQHLGFPNERRGEFIDSALQLRSMKVSWRSKSPGEPVSFDIIDGIPHMVVYTEGRVFCQQNPGRYRATFLKWHGGAWETIGQDDFPSSKALVNLYFRYWGRTTDDDARGLITWAQKAINDGFDAEEPETVKAWYEKPNRKCPELQSKH